MNQEKKDTKNKKLWAFVGIAAIILILNRVFGWSSYLGDVKNLEFLQRMVEEHLWSAVAVYTVVTVVACVVLALPGVTFAILAGLLFGPFLGTLCCSVATTIGAALAFLAGRFFLKDTIKPMAMKNKYLRKWLFDESDRNELFVLMLTRLIPVFPYNLQNFAYGVTDIRFGTYTVGSFLFMLPGTAMYTIGTAGLADKENRVLYIGIAIVLVIVMTALGAFFKKRYIGEDVQADGLSSVEADAESGQLPGEGKAERKEGCGNE